MSDSTIIEDVVRLCDSKSNEIAQSNINNVVPLIIGDQGIGKSGIVEQTANKLHNAYNGNYGFVKLSGSNLEHPSDVLGYPEPDLETGYTEHLPPEWFGRTLEHDNGILFIDEFLRVAPPAQNALYDFILTGRLGDECLQDGWTIVCASNPPTQDFHVEQMDLALIDRFLVLPYAGDKDAWFDWAEHNNIHDDIVDFYRDNPGLIELERPEVPFDIEPTLRSLELASILYDRSLDEEILQVIVEGLWGSEHVESFKEYVMTKERQLRPKDILTQYPRHRERIKDYATGAEKRLDILNPLINKIHDYLEARAEEDEDLNKYKKYLQQFLLDLPADAAASAFNKFGEIDESLVKSQEVFQHIG